MNYKKIYQDLIERAKTRPPPPFFEKHHIVPRCLGGSADSENLAKVTPEEHYVAHQLLVKIYPDNDSLVYAAQMMVPNRPNNKMYGWLKRRHREVCQKRIGKKNGAYGTRWITDGKDNKKIHKNEKIPVGWKKGRFCLPRTLRLFKIKCAICDKVFEKKRATKTCSRSCAKELGFQSVDKERLSKILSEKAKIRAKNFPEMNGLGTRWATNGVKNMRLRLNVSVPNGWRLGKLHKILHP